MCCEECIGEKPFSCKNVRCFCHMQNASDTAEDKIARQQDDLSVCAIATHAITAYVFLVVTADKVTASQVFTERTISENKAFGTYRVHSTKNGAYFNTAKLLI